MTHLKHNRIVSRFQHVFVACQAVAFCTLANKRSWSWFVYTFSSPRPRSSSATLLGVRLWPGLPLAIALLLLLAAPGAVSSTPPLPPGTLAFRLRKKPACNWNYWIV